MERIKLIDTIDVEKLFNPSEIGGIFREIYETIFEDEHPLFPWLTQSLSMELDRIYYLHHSGDKFISKTYEFLRKRYENTYEGDLVALSFIAKMVMEKFANSWNRIYSALVESQYNPLENYDMEQIETPDITHKKNVKQSITTSNDVYGFNSVSKVPQSESNISGDKVDNEEESTETGTRGLTRHGNIGVTTSQQMLTAELDLRTQNHFMDIIMNDTDSILCLLAY